MDELHWFVILCLFLAIVLSVIITLCKRLNDIKKSSRLRFNLNTNHRHHTNNSSNSSSITSTNIPGCNTNNNSHSVNDNNRINNNYPYVIPVPSNNQAIRATTIRAFDLNLPSVTSSPTSPSASLPSSLTVSAYTTVQNSIGNRKPSCTERWLPPPPNYEELPPPCYEEAIAIENLSRQKNVEKF